MDSYEKYVKRVKDDTDEIINTNKDYQSRIKSLLQGANACRLHKIFEFKAAQAERISYFWLACIIITIGAVVGYTVYRFNDFIAGENEAFFLLKRFIFILPIALFEGFLIYQYNLRSKISDEYRFKSTIALSLWVFDDLIKKNKDEDITKEFLIDSVNKIYESPLSDDSFGKKQKNLLNSLLKVVGSKVDKAADNAIDSLTGK